MPSRALHRLALLLAFVVSCGCGGHPSDERLLEVFKDRRPELEQLVRMFEADRGLSRVAQHFTQPEHLWSVGVSTERVEDYRRLCAAVGARACIEGSSKDPIWIHVSALGLASSGSAKGFLYSSAPAFEVVGDLDRFLPPALEPGSGTSTGPGISTSTIADWGIVETPICRRPVDHEPNHQPPEVECPDCGAALVHVNTEISSGAFRTQAASMPQMPIHFYDCPDCNTCWKLGTKLMPDPVRQILKS